MHPPHAIQTIRLANKLVVIIFLTHLLFLLIVLCISSTARSPRYIYPDSKSYIVPAQNIVLHGKFSREQSPPYLWEPYRTPGYPLLIAFSIWLTGRPEAVLFLAPLFAALMGYCLIWLTWELFFNQKAALVAGGIAAFFPSGLGLSTAILTDFIHGCLFIVAFYTTLKAIKYVSWPAAVLTSVMWISTQLIRPTLSLAIILIFLLGVWLARSRQQIIVVAILMVFSLLAPLLLSFANYREHGVFTPSLLGQATIAEYAILRGEAMATGWNYEKLREEVREMDEISAISANGKSTYGKLYHVQGGRINEAIGKYRFYILAGFGVEAVRQILAPWDTILIAIVGEVTPRSRAILGIVYGIFLLCAASGTIRAFRHGNGSAALVVWLTFLFWVLTGSISTYVGSRLRFPGDLLLITLVSMGTLIIFEPLIRKTRQILRHEPVASLSNYYQTASFHRTLTKETIIISCLN